MSNGSRNVNKITVELEAGWTTLSLAKPIEGVAVETCIEREKWERIVAYLPRKAISHLQANVGDGGNGVLKCEFDAEWQSIHNLLSIMDEYDTMDLAIALAEGWGDVSLEKRVGRWWGDGIYPIAAQCQILGLRHDLAVSSLGVPSWAVSLVKCAHFLGGISFDLPIGIVQWHLACTPLGNTCIAEIYRDNIGFRVWSFMSDCPAWSHDDFSLEEKRAVVKSLDPLLDAVMKDGAAGQGVVWRPTGHEALKIRAAILQWSELVWV